MIFKNGGIIGPVNTSNTTYASGMWSLNEVLNRKVNGVWPVPPSGPTLLAFDSGHDAVDRSTYTFSSMDIGAASADRYVVVVMLFLDTGTSNLSSITIGGNTATISANKNVTFFSQMGYAIGIYNLTTGTTADVVVNLSATVSWCEVGVFSFSGLSSTTATDTFAPGSFTSSVTSYNMNTDVAASGVMVGGMILYTGSGIDITMSGLSESLDQDSASTSSRVWWGYYIAGSAETPRTISASWTGSQNVVGCVAAYPSA